jgi:hypothetical protein
LIRSIAAIRISDLQLDGSDRPGEEVVGARRLATALRLEVVRPGHHDHRDEAGLRLDQRRHLEPVDRRHDHVEQHQLRVRLAHHAQPLEAARGAHRAVPERLDHAGHLLAAAAHVVDDQDGGRLARRRLGGRATRGLGRGERGLRIGSRRCGRGRRVAAGSGRCASWRAFRHVRSGAVGENAIRCVHARSRRHLRLQLR